MATDADAAAAAAAAEGTMPPNPYEIARESRRKLVEILGNGRIQQMRIVDIRVCWNVLEICVGLSTSHMRRALASAEERAADDVACSGLRDLLIADKHAKILLVTDAIKYVKEALKREGEVEPHEWGSEHDCQALRLFRWGENLPTYPGFSHVISSPHACHQHHMDDKRLDLIAMLDHLADARGNAIKTILCKMQSPSYICTNLHVGWELEQVGLHGRIWKALAFCMGTHARLGDESIVLLLSKDVVQDIVMMVVAEDWPGLKQHHLVGMA